MPRYDYACSACHHVVEVIHGINDPGPRFCPNCGREGTMRKAWATPAVHFKGSGWAKKDRSATSSPGRARTSSGSDSSAGSESSGGSESSSGADSSSGGDPSSGSTGSGKDAKTAKSSGSSSSSTTTKSSDGD